MTRKTFESYWLCTWRFLRVLLTESRKTLFTSDIQYPGKTFLDTLYCFHQSNEHTNLKLKNKEGQDQSYCSAAPWNMTLRRRNFRKQWHLRRPQMVENSRQMPIWNRQLINSQISEPLPCANEHPQSCQFWHHRKISTTSDRNCLLPRSWETDLGTDQTKHIILSQQQDPNSSDQKISLRLQRYVNPEIIDNAI